MDARAWGIAVANARGDALTKGVYGHLAVLKLLQIAAYDKDLGNAARRVLVLISGYSDGEGCCWPSVNKMAYSLGVERSAINKQTKALAKRGYLKILPRHDEWTGARKSNQYQLNIDYASKHYGRPDLLSENPQPPQKCQA